MGDRRLVYLDTSALAKWYLNEPFSDQVERFIASRAPLVISTLTVVELRCLLSRRRRIKEIDAAHEALVFATFEEDMRRGHLLRRSVDDDSLQAAAGLIATLPRHPLRILDALHLAVARDAAAELIATADAVMAGAAEELSLEAVRFF